MHLSTRLSVVYQGRSVFRKSGQYEFGTALINEPG